MSQMKREKPLCKQTLSLTRWKKDFETFSVSEQIGNMFDI